MLSEQAPVPYFCRIHIAAGDLISLIFANIMAHEFKGIGNIFKIMAYTQLCYLRIQELADTSNIVVLTYCSKTGKTTALQVFF